MCQDIHFVSHLIPLADYIFTIQSLNPFFYNNKTQKIEVLDGFILYFLSFFFGWAKVLEEVKDMISKLREVVIPI